MKLLVHASGFENEPKLSGRIGEQQEIRCQLHKKCGGDPKCHWSPSSKDFKDAGAHSGGSSPAASVDDLMKTIERQAVNSIEELRILGHANSSVLALAGAVRKDDVYFTKEDAWIGPES